MVAMWRMVRPLIMVSNVIAWLLGVSISSGFGVSNNLPSLILALLAMLLVSASVHYVNEYADFDTDLLTVRTLYSGGSGVLPSGLVPRISALYAGIVTLVLGVGVQLGAVLMGFNSWSALLVLILGTFGGWMYSMPPLKVGWKGLGELLNAFLGGILLPLHAYVVTTGKINPRVPLMCLPVMLLCFNNLLAVTWPDRIADSHAGKMTLANRWSAKSLRRLHISVGVLSFSILFAMAGWIIPVEVVLTSLLSAPLFVWGSQVYTKKEIALGSIYAMVTIFLAQIATLFALGI